MHPQLNQHKHQEINYGIKYQLSPVEDTSPALDAAGVKTIQAIICALLYYASLNPSKHQPLKTLTQPSNSSLITLLRIQIMVSFIAPATWSLQTTLMLDSTINLSAEDKQARIYFYLGMTLNPGGMFLSSQLHKLSNFS